MVALIDDSSTAAKSATAVNQTATNPTTTAKSATPATATPATATPATATPATAKSATPATAKSANKALTNANTPAAVTAAAALKKSGGDMQITGDPSGNNAGTTSFTSTSIPATSSVSQLMAAEAPATEPDTTINNKYSIMVFFILTTFYSVFSYVTNKGNKSNRNTTYFFIYVLLVVVTQYFINVSLTKTFCLQTQMSTSLQMTIIPWIAIFGVINLIILVFPGWLVPFANTFGYGFAKLLGLDNLMKNHVLKPEAYVTDPQLKTTLAEITTDPTLIFNQIPENEAEYDNFWKEMEPLRKKYSGDKLEVEEQVKDKLHHLVQLKYTVAWYIWYMLSGLLTITVSINWLISSGCTQSAELMIKRHEDYDKCLNATTPSDANTYCPTSQIAEDIISDLSGNVAKNRVYIKPYSSN